MSYRTAQDIQDEIFIKMPAEKKLRIAGQLFLFGRRLAGLRKQKPYEANKAN